MWALFNYVILVAQTKELKIKKHKKVLIIGLVLPEPATTAAGVRMYQLMELLLVNFDIIYASTSAFNQFSEQLNEKGVQTLKIEVNDSDFDRILQKIDPDIVMFDRFISEEQFGWRVAEICPNTLRILDTEDLHFLRDTRKNISSEQNLLLKIKENDLTKREIASILRCDVALIISRFEMDLLIQDFKMDQQILLYLPFLVDIDKITKPSIYPGFSERTDFMYIGNFKHEPNKAAVTHLKNIIWPKIRAQIPNAKINIYGAYADEVLKGFHKSDEGFLIRGQINEAKDAFINSRVCLAPLQFGAGQKGKLLESMIFGTPNVTTTIGAEGMSNGDYWNGYITDDDTEFAELSVTLFQNRSIWEKSQQKGIEILKKNFDEQKFSEKFITKINDMLLNLSSHRHNNFLGSLLNFHMLRSTKFLSRWIEEKNKKLQ